MTNILPFQTDDQTFYRRFVRDTLPEHRTQDIINDLKPLRMHGEEDAILRGVLFAELAVKSERVQP